MNSTRSRVYWCHWRPHMGTPKSILQREFGYTQEVDPKAGDEWDLIFGGYPNCGDGSVKFDYQMKTGLNKYLSEKGWDKLSPHQVWFPCMGCKDSYCNKRDLCYLMKKIDPNYCFSLPDDQERLVELMEIKNKTSSRQFWVVKKDNPNEHLHSGHGVRFIESVEELPNMEDRSSGMYLVQPLVHHRMGKDGYKMRRHELRMHVSITSTSPLRAYAYSKNITGMFANHEINNTNPLEPCSVDTHGRNHQIELGCRINQDIQSFDQISENLELTDIEKGLFISRTTKLMAKILILAQPDIQNHTVNRGITASGAACFSFLRVDFAMNQDLKPYIYEINEFPFANFKGLHGAIQGAAYRDLFHMIGLDKPALVPSQRSEYELANLGNWVPLVIDDKLIL
eukprot:scaffold25831_cov38-Cyclotella_meneghiniana.AAC.2